MTFVEQPIGRNDAIQILQRGASGGGQILRQIIRDVLDDALFERRRRTVGLAPHRVAWGLHPVRNIGRRLSAFAAAPRASPPAKLPARTTPPTIAPLRRKRRRDVTTPSFWISTGSVTVHPPFVAARISGILMSLAIHPFNARKDKKMKRTAISAKAEEQNSRPRIFQTEAVTRRSIRRLSRI